MPRNMSFMLTKEQVRDKTKTVTRRNGWWFLNAGDIVNACEKCQGLKKGEKIVKTCQIRILSTRTERLCRITQDECVKEGLPEMTPVEFVKFFWLTHKGVTPASNVNRIEFEYI